MRPNQIAVLTLLILCAACPTPGIAALDVSAKDWQLQSLKGITSIKYGVAYDPTKKLTPTVTSKIASTKTPTKLINLKTDAANKLNQNEARVTVYIDDKEKDQSWVGLSVDQKSLLARDPSVTFDGQTYRIGTLCPRAKVKETVSAVCEQFISDLKTQANK